MILINFGHPVTDAQLETIRQLCGAPVERVVNVPCSFDLEQPFAEQAAALVDSAGLSQSEWQTLPLLVNAPGLAPAALAVMAELHGRCGYFPSVLRLRPAGGTPPRFDVAEILNLQALRDEARTRRF